MSARHPSVEAPRVEAPRVEVPRVEVPRVEVVIDEIILRGVPVENGPAVVEAFRRRLEELVVATVPDALGELAGRAEASRRLGSIGLTGDSAAELGRSVAESVWASIGPVEPGGP